MINNGGKSLNKMSFRTLTNFRSRGISKGLVQYAVAYMTSAFPSVTEHVIGLIYEPEVQRILNDPFRATRLIQCRVSVITQSIAVIFTHPKLFRRLVLVTP